MYLSVAYIFFEKVCIWTTNYWLVRANGRSVIAISRRIWRQICYSFGRWNGRRQNFINNIRWVYTVRLPIYFFHNLLFLLMYSCRIFAFNFFSKSSLIRVITSSLLQQYFPLRAMLLSFLKFLLYLILAFAVVWSKFKTIAFWDNFHLCICLWSYPILNIQLFHLLLEFFRRLYFKKLKDFDHLFSK